MTITTQPAQHSARIERHFAQCEKDAKDFIAQIMRELDAKKERKQ